MTKKLKKLVLKKDVVANLDEKAMSKVEGGASWAGNCTGGTCATYCNCTATCKGTMCNCPSNAYTWCGCFY